MQILDNRIKINQSKREYLSPKLSSNNKQIIYNDIKRPLKQNLSDLSFKGLFLKAPEVINEKEVVGFCKKYMGQNVDKYLDNIAEKTGSLITKNDKNEFLVGEKTVLKLALDGMAYPFTILPFDMLRGTVSLIGKLPGLGKWSEKVLGKDFFKAIDRRSSTEWLTNSYNGIITYKSKKINSALERYAESKGIKIEQIPENERNEIVAKVEKSMADNVFIQSMKMFDPKNGRYDTKHERALNRLVSGAPPAGLLAIDAYNLSRMMDDDDEAAKREQKTRLRQEVVRILSSGYLTLITMGAFQKYINTKKYGIALNTGLTVLFTEMISRLSNGKHITRLTPEEAKEINKKEQGLANNENKSKATKTKSSQVQTQKPLLSLDTLLKASAVIVGAGYGIRGIQKLPFVEKAAQNFFTPKRLDKYKLKAENIEKGADAVKAFKDKVLFGKVDEFYKYITQIENRAVDKDEISRVAQMVKDSGFEEIAKTMQKGIEKNISPDDGKVYLGQKDRFIKPFVNFVIAPFKFIGKTISLPYRMVKKVEDVIIPPPPKKGVPIEDQIRQALSQSFDRITKYEQKLKNKYNDENVIKEKLHEFIKTSIIKSFNSTSMSGVSNAELSNLAKTAASVATIWFLMTDNYNMVMLKSNGEDKLGAETKFKERFVQEGSRLFYQTLLIDLFNSTFRNQYNSSLFGMSWITFIDTFIGEILTRKSVGTPVLPHTRDELKQIENEQMNSTGFKKKYYNFMQRLTGKRPISAYEVSKQN